LGGLRKIDCIMLRVSDLEASARFYEDVMGLRRGWTDTDRGMIGFLFPGNDSEIVIHNDEGLPNPSYSFSVDDVTEFCNEYTNRDYRVLEGPFDVRTGKYAVLEDPDGNRVDIIDLTGFGGKPRYDR